MVICFKISAEEASNKAAIARNFEASVKQFDQALKRLEAGMKLADPCVIALQEAWDAALVDKGAMEEVLDRIQDEADALHAELSAQEGFEGFAEAALDQLTDAINSASENLEGCVEEWNSHLESIAAEGGITKSWLAQAQGICIDMTLFADCIEDEIVLKHPVQIGE